MTALLLLYLYQQHSTHLANDGRYDKYSDKRRYIMIYNYGLSESKVGGCGWLNKNDKP